MMFGYDNSRTLRLVAQTEEEEGFLRNIANAFFEGSVTIDARNHKHSTQCLECESAKRYRDCVTSSCTLSADEPSSIITL